MAQNRKFSIIRAVELSLQSLLLLILITQLILLKCVISYGYIPLPAKRINSYLATHSIQSYAWLHLAISYDLMAKLKPSAYSVSCKQQEADIVC